VRIATLLFPLLLSACSSNADGEPSSSFGAAEAHTALTGTWSGAYTAGGTSGTITLELALANPSPQPKCSQRTLGLKCIDTTDVRLVGNVTTSDGTHQATPLTGSLLVLGRTLSHGDLNMTTTDGKTLVASYEEGELRSGRLEVPTGGATFTLTRN
jgi:hypothetical protein